MNECWILSNALSASNAMFNILSHQSNANQNSPEIPPEVFFFFNPHNPLYKQTQRQKLHDHLVRYRESIWQNPTPIHDKSLGSGIQGPYLNMIKAIYSKPVGNIKVNGEKVEAIPLKLGSRQGCPLSPYLFNIVFEVLARAFWQQMEIMGIHIRNEEVKIPHFTGDIIVYISDPKNSNQELLILINSFSEEPGYKIN